ncbi:hypothetical protein FKM82_026264 [Ascaphus truei]
MGCEQQDILRARKARESVRTGGTFGTFSPLHPRMGIGDFHGKLHFKKIHGSCLAGYTQGEARPKGRQSPFCYKRGAPSGRKRQRRR